MSYQVLARKWRPRNFASLVGQEHVVKALRHALEQQRLHHAYLFTGTRGVGKTTLARILAKCVNCETGITPEPCGKCAACVEIDGGRFVDLIEIDAATNTGIDEMRALQDNAAYVPVRGRFKVFVIDEVHMLSKAAFNSMLKTLEEPPAHLKFILATTDPQKIPVTVLSRCLQFNLKQMPAPAIVAYLEKILPQEKIAFEREALILVARAAAGSMRDALSLLDQAIAHGAGKLEAAGVREMLGSVDETYLLRALEALAKNDGPALAAIAAEMQARSLSFDLALQELASLLLRITLAQTVPAALEEDLPERARVIALAGALDAEAVQLYYQIAIQGREDLALAPDEHAGFLMTLLRMLAFAPSGNENREEKKTAPAAAPKAAAEFDGNWPALAGKLSLAGGVKELARNAELKSSSAAALELVVPKTMAHLTGESYREKLQAALTDHFGRPMQLRVGTGETRGTSVAALEAADRGARKAQATRAVQGDSFVQDLVNLFDGRVVDSTIKDKR
ncbi:MAG TPA: DNA polymerase III subunit gamma/tau [Burkholderiales bacterium]|jgi:DNA polymerase-3 subunit gamma/tau|nr:DNA polymerase III subunit gamma/tau [Burkholderiales bacterium]